MMGSYQIGINTLGCGSPFVRASHRIHAMLQAGTNASACERSIQSLPDGLNRVNNSGNAMRAHQKHRDAKTLQLRVDSIGPVG
jgi:hypothetical protein